MAPTSPFTATLDPYNQTMVPTIPPTLLDVLAQNDIAQWVMLAIAVPPFVLFVYQGMRFIMSPRGAGSTNRQEDIELDEIDHSLHPTPSQSNGTINISVDDHVEARASAEGTGLPTILRPKRPEPAHRRDQLLNLGPIDPRQIQALPRSAPAA